MRLAYRYPREKSKREGQSRGKKKEERDRADLFF